MHIRLTLRQLTIGPGGDECGVQTQRIYACFKRLCSAVRYVVPRELLVPRWSVLFSQRSSVEKGADNCAGQDHGSFSAVKSIYV
jgi:hypothetical protein